MKKQTLLNAAKELFAKRGIGNTSLKDIAERSGVPLGNIYYYYKTKLDIVRDVIAGYAECLVTVLSEIQIQQGPGVGCVIKYLEGIRNESALFARHNIPMLNIYSELVKDTKKYGSLIKGATSILKIGPEWIYEQLNHSFKEYGDVNINAMTDNLLNKIYGAIAIGYMRCDEGYIKAGIDNAISVLKWVAKSKTFKDRKEP